MDEFPYENIKHYAIALDMDGLFLIFSMKTSDKSLTMMNSKLKFREIIPVNKLLKNRIPEEANEMGRHAEKIT